MFPNTRLPGVALQWKHPFFTHLSFIFSGYLFSHCARKLLGEQTPIPGSLLRESSLVRLALQTRAQNDPLNPHEESL